MAFRHPFLASAISAVAVLTAATSLARAQVFVVGEKSAMADVSTDFHPTRVEQPTTPITERGRRELIRNLEAEQGFAHRPLPLGQDLVLMANGNLKPGGDAYKQMLYKKGQAAAPGDRVAITTVTVKADRIVFDLNGGPYLKHRFLRHIELNDTPLAAADGSQVTGCRVTLVFEGGIPEISAPEVKALLDPLIDFGVKTSAEAYADSLPQFLKDAIDQHDVLVGMNRKMVLAAMGAPESKVRELVPGSTDRHYEEWLYGQVPQTVRPAAGVSLVSQDVRGGFHRVLPGDRAVSVDLPVDRILGRQLFLQPDAADEELLVQPVCARRGQRSGNGQPVYLLRRDLPPAALRETLSEAPPADRRRFHRLRLAVSVPVRFRAYRRQPAAHPAARLAGQDRPFRVARRRRERVDLFPPGADRGPGSHAPLAPCRRGPCHGGVGRRPFGIHGDVADIRWQPHVQPARCGVQFRGHAGRRMRGAGFRAGDLPRHAAPQRGLRSRGRADAGLFLDRLPVVPVHSALQPQSPARQCRTIPGHADFARGGLCRRRRMVRLRARDPGGGRPAESALAFAGHVLPPAPPADYGAHPGPGRTHRRRSRHAGVGLSRGRSARARRGGYAGGVRHSPRIVALRIHGAGARHVVDSLRRHAQRRAPERGAGSAPQGLRVRRPGVAAARLGSALLERRSVGSSGIDAAGNGAALPAQSPAGDHRRGDRRDSRLHSLGQRAARPRSLAFPGCHDPALGGMLWWGRLRPDRRPGQSLLGARHKSGNAGAMWGRLAACAAVGYRRRPVPTRHLAD